MTSIMQDAGILQIFVKHTSCPQDTNKRRQSHTTIIMCNVISIIIEVCRGHTRTTEERAVSGVLFSLGF